MRESEKSPTYRYITRSEWLKRKNPNKNRNYMVYSMVILKDMKTMLPIQCRAVAEMDGGRRKMGISDTQNVKSTAFNVKRSNQKNDAADIHFVRCLAACVFCMPWFGVYMYQCVVSARFSCCCYYFESSRQKERFESSARLPIHMCVFIESALGSIKHMCKLIRKVATSFV